ncbi:MAG TPA: hemolysin III family protein [Candidatus Hydrogenedentes bacterium]|nr:hemolysin III family protein [Candidatus Hydrogenedentota bacterium]HQE83904.1 hemolysin III family protein [Candidatus Hydrogenedentota bacterium]HQH51018.1 hemolysin III family protein [Candidatus Hydrogenedentota bacterium]HQM48345.1 hemolysin III family protein [Candidatus Hydrogenedentota bacterium]
MFGRREQTRREELVNSATHGVAVALSIAALTVLVVFSSLQGDPWKIVGFSIYGASLIALYTASTVYHAVPSRRFRPFLRRLDHSCIYLLIAGTYTPFVLVVVRDAWGWTLFGLVWASAITGILFKIFYTGRFEIVSTLWYVMMGWTAIIAIKPLIQTMPAGVWPWLVGGGLCYTFGVLFYAMGKLRYNHAVWHLFVLCGSLLHFLSFLLFVLPENG